MRKYVAEGKGRWETNGNKFEEQIRKTANVKDREPWLVGRGEGERRREERLDPPKRVDRPENIFNFITACNMEILRSQLSGVNWIIAIADVVLLFMSNQKHVLVPRAFTMAGDRGDARCLMPVYKTSPRY